MTLVIIAPTTTITAPDKPEALADKSRFTDMIAAFALGDVKPFPTPTQTVPAKRLTGETKPNQKTRRQAKRPKHATKRPDRTISSRLYCTENLLDKTQSSFGLVPSISGKVAGNQLDAGSLRA